MELAVDRPAHARPTATSCEVIDTATARVVPRCARARPESRTAGTQSDYRESEAQTAPYTPEAFLPARPSTRQRALCAAHHVPGNAGEPEVLTLRNGDLNDDAGAPLGAADVDRIERARAKRAFEASLPHLSDIASLRLRRELMEQWEEAEWAEREREIARAQEERLVVLKAAVDAREVEAESVAEQRLARARREATSTKKKKFDAARTKRVRGLRKLELRRLRAREASAVAMEGPVSRSAGRAVADHASYAGGVYTRVTREGRAGPGASSVGPVPARLAFDDFLELEATIPAGALDTERTVRAAARASSRVTGRPRPPRARRPSRSRTDDGAERDRDGFAETTPSRGAPLRPDANAAPADPEARREAAYFEQLDRAAEALVRSKAANGGERGVGAIWPAPLRDEKAEEKTLATRAARKTAKAATKPDDGPRRAERPNMPELEPPLDGTASKFRAVVLLQRLLRGRGAQNATRRGIERGAERVAELGADERTRDSDEASEVEAHEEANAFPTDDGRDVSAGPLARSDDSNANESQTSSAPNASVAQATARALAVVAVPDAERIRRSGAATVIQAAHRGRSERRRLVLERARAETTATAATRGADETFGGRCDAEANEVESTTRMDDVPMDVSLATGAAPSEEDLVSFSALSPSARATQTAARRYLEEALGASASVRLDELPPDDAEKVRRLQALAKKLAAKMSSAEARHMEEDLDKDGDDGSD